MNSPSNILYARTKRRRWLLPAILALLLSNLFILTTFAASDFTDGTNLFLDLETSESVTILSNGTSYIFTLDGSAIWNGTDNGNVTGNGTNTLTVTADAFTDIALTDSGTGTAVTFGNSGANAFSDNFSITLDAGGSTVTVANVTSFSDGSLTMGADTIWVIGALSTANMDLSLNGNVMDIQATVSAGSGIVTLAPMSAGRLIDLGSLTDVAANTLELSDVEIDQITANVLRIGSTNAGSINFTKAISPAGTSTLSLITGDEINDNNTSGADVQVANLAMQAVNGVTDSGNALLDTNIDTLAILNTTSGAISTLEAAAGGDLTIGTVDGIVGVTNTSNTGPMPTLGIQIETNNGNLTVDSDIYLARKTIFLAAQQGNGGSGDRLFTNNANINAANVTNGEIKIDANNMSLAGGSLAAPYRVILEDDPSSSAIVPIDLGGADGVNILGLTSSELDTISTGNLRIGHNGTGNIDITAPIDLTDGPDIATTNLISGGAIPGNGSNGLTANTLNLTAATTIGASGDPLMFNATALITSSTGDQVLEETDSVLIGDNDLNAGAGNTIQLVGGTIIHTDSGTIQSNVLLQNDAILTGTGTVNGTVTAMSGSTLTPGNGVGVLTTGDINFSAGSNFEVEVNDVTSPGLDYDQLIVSGSVAIDPGANLDLTGGITNVELDDTIVVINNDGSDLVSGNFSGLPEGALTNINGQDFRFYYNGGDGNDVVLVITLDIVCPTLFPVNVFNETFLNTAITCFNMLTVPDVYTLTIGADIPLVTATVPVNNPLPGISLKIVGNGYTVDGQGLAEVRPFEIQPDTTVFMSDLTITGGNSSSEFGGGILNAGILALQNATIVENSAFAGGGLHNTGSLTIQNSTIMSNTAIGGGGIANYGGTLTVSQSTIHNNIATVSFGGGIQTNFNGVLTIENSTISGNQAGWNGGGIGTSSDYQVVITNSTIANNTADYDNGGLAGDGGGFSAFGTTIFTLTNTIIADNQDASGGAPDCVALSGGTITSQGYNLIGDTTGCTLTTQATDLLDQNAMLDSLADNGGDTQTHALLTGSPAINAIPNGTNECGTTVTSDQRGFVRPQGVGCDIGSFEAGCPVFPVVVTDETSLNNALICYNALTTSGSYTITITANITLTAQTVAIDNSQGTSLTINGNNHTLDGASSYRLLTILDSDVTIVNMTLQNGNAAADCQDIYIVLPKCGGAIKVKGPAAATLNNITLLNSQANRGGGLFNQGGNVTINTSVISGNSTNYYGGGLGNYGGSMAISNSTLVGNTSFYGGGLSNETTGTLTITDSTITENMSNGDGGGLYNGGELATISNTTISENSAPYGNGGGGSNYGAMFMSNSIIAGNSATGYGGGLSNGSTLTLTQVIFNENQAEYGGGMDSNGIYSPTLTNVTFTHNAATHGGGLYNYFSSPTLMAVTFYSNTATIDGGGISNIANSNSAFTNVTLSGNSAGQSGGGIFNFDSHPTLTYVTLTDNMAVTSGGGLFNDSSSPTLDGVILWGNSAPTGPQVANDTSIGPSNPNFAYSDIEGSGGSGAGWDPALGTDNGGNLDTDPLLAPLTNNGGDIQTHALLSGSPAIDHIPNGVIGCGTTITSDQRGIARPQGTGCDIGAFEVGCATFPVSVTNETELNNAISCYNALATPGSYTVTITADITLTAQTTAINNSYDTSLQINGNDHIMDGAGSYRHFHIIDSHVTLANMTLQNGYAPADCSSINPGFPRCGGAIRVDSWAEVTLSYMNILNNNANLGGGLFNYGGIVNVDNSTISDNAGGYRGGGLINRDGTMTVKDSTISGNASAYNSGVSNEGTGTIFITNSTISGNVADLGGGGLYNEGNLATVSNSTISGNSVLNGLFGGVHNHYSTMMIINTSIVGNSANGNGGGLSNAGDNLTVFNSIIANNTGGSDCDGVDDTSVNATNLDSDGTCGDAVQSSNINLGLLQDNGGATFTHALLAGSDAINAGDDAICAAEPVNNLDQRGIVRPQGSGCDIGAFEAELATLTVSVSGEESGMVTSDPAEINCGLTCTAYFPVNSVITLTATPDTGSYFAGWSGDVVGADNPVVITMDNDKSIIAGFALVPPEIYTLTIALEGTGQGTVSSMPEGINCGPDCSVSFEAGTVITLTAIAEEGSIFVGWQGACSGTGECVVTMDEAKSVTAIFDKVSTSSFMIYLPTISKP